MRLRLVPALAFLLAASPVVAAASAPVGVWSLVDKVTLEPSKDNPTTIRVDGLFLIANELPDYPQYPGYSEPRSGYMYYKCDGNDQATCVTEWQELGGIAGTADNCRGWGSNALPDNGSVRTVDPAGEPDTWPIAMGIQPGFSPCEALKMWNGGDTESGGTDSTTTTTTEPGTTAGEGDQPSGGEEASASDPEPSAGSTLGTDPSGGTAGTNPTGDPGSTGGGETAASGDNPTTSPEATGTTAAGEATGTTAAGEGGQTDTTPPVDDGDKAGCACDSRGPAPLGSLALLTLLGLVRRRR